MSNKLNYTPGPWSWWPECCRDGGMVTEDTHGGGHICAPTNYPTRPELTAANAKLIAASPDMYELIRRVSCAGNETTVEQLAQEAAMLLAKLEAHND